MMKRYGLVFLLALVIGLVTTPAYAGLQQQVDHMFDSMSNATAPGAVMDQRRGLISGGQFSLRNKVMDVQLLSVLPPSFSAGCNGIDLFGGSFSFISAAQFTQLLRAIASNAAGYAFKAALQAMCPSCSDIITNLQSIMQKLNGLSVDSCQTAKNLVNKATALTPSVVGTGVNHAASGIARATGAVDDALGSLFSADNSGRSALQAVSSTKQGRKKLKDQGITGNVVWQALSAAHAGQWWNAGDQQFMEAVMSLTGSVIIEPPEDGQDQPKITTLPPILDMADFMNGTGSDKVTIYDCESMDACTRPTRQNINLEDFKRQVADLSRSIVEKYATNTPMTDKEKAFVRDAPASIGAIFRNLSLHGAGMGELFADQVSSKIASIMASHLVLNMIHTAIDATGKSHATNMAQVRHFLDQAFNRAQREALNIKTGISNIQQVVNGYATLQRIAEKRRLGVTKILSQGRAAQSQPRLQ